MMKKRIIVILSIFFSLFVISKANIITQNQKFEKALNLYDRGMYERSKELFDQIKEYDDRALIDGYSLLCELYMNISKGENEVENYISKYPYSRLIPHLYFVQAENYFSEKEYIKCLSLLQKTYKEKLDKKQLPRYIFKKAYCEFILGDYKAAKLDFKHSLKYNISDYNAPAYYALAYIAYTREEFDRAFDLFDEASKDPRFENMSRYYMLECRFMKKDYRFVSKYGSKIYETIPKERQKHLARILSESYLILGNLDKAKYFLDKSPNRASSSSRKDLFHAGTVLYSVGDYRGAIANYSKIPTRKDSIGQIANYNLAYSYIKLKNKVSAMKAFKDASIVDFDKKIQEDAYFNYAKLAFDLNKDPRVFDRYIAKYKNRKQEERIYSYIALSALYNRDYQGAIDAYDNIDDLDRDMQNNYKKANYLRASQLVANSAYRDAIPFLKTSAYYSDKHSYFNQLSRFWLAESYYKDKKYEQAIELFKELYNNSGLDGLKEGDLIPYNLAYIYFNLEDYPQAAKWFDTYLKSNRSLYGKDAAIRRADCDFAQKQYKDAAEKYAVALDNYSYNPNDIYPYYQQGIAYGLAGDKSKKISALSRVKEANNTAPYYSETVYELGRALIDGGYNVDAINTFKSLKNTTGDSTYMAKALIELAMIERNSKNYEEALNYYKEVVDKMDRTEYAETSLNSIQDVYQSMGSPELYVEYIDSLGTKVNKTDEEKEDIFFNASEQIFLNANYQKAITSLKEFHQRYPENQNKDKANFYLAESYRHIGEKDLAIDHYKKVLDSGDSTFVESSALNMAELAYGMERYLEAYDTYDYLNKHFILKEYKSLANLGMMHSAYKLKDYEKSVAAAESVITLYDKDEKVKREAKYILAKSYLALSQRDKAFKIFEYLARAPKTDQGAEATYLIIKSLYDAGKFKEVQPKVYDFAQNAPNQSYWLAKSFIVLADSFVELDNIPQAKATFESIKNGYKPEEGHNDPILDIVNDRLNKLANLQ